MIMGYLVLSHPPGQSQAAFAVMTQALARQPAWTQMFTAYGLAAFVSGPRPPRVTPLIGAAGVGGLLVGEAHDRAATAAGRAAAADLAGLADQDPLDAGRRLIANAWGDYVAVLAPDRRTPPALFAAPMGALPAFAWTRNGVTVMGSEIPDGPSAPENLTIDWDRLRDILREPARAGGAPPLRGLRWIPPGTMRHGRDAADLTPLWSPAAVVRAQKGVIKTAGPELAARLRQTVDATVLAQAGASQPILCEVSGGLDSAIVATSLTAVARPPARLTNFYRDQIEADERAYAQAVADRIAAPLVTMVRAPMTMSEATLAFSARSVQPNFNAVDIEYDRLLQRQIEEVGAARLFTGHGGDVVFLQIGAAELAADLLAGAPCEGSRRARLADIARRTRRSVWSLAWQAVTGRPGFGAPERLVDRVPLAGLAPAGPGHPWTQDLDDLTATKRLQVGGLVLSQRVFHQTLRDDQVRQAHPLLSLPVVELSLAIPAPLLSSGEGERTLARRAFADRLPPSILARRSKGDISVFFGQSLARSVAFLRQYLLGGRLAEQGLLDTRSLDALLDPDALIWRDDYGQILAAATLEAWVRHWEGRIESGLAAGSSPDAPTVSRRKSKARR